MSSEAMPDYTVGRNEVESWKEVAKSCCSKSVEILALSNKSRAELSP